MNMTLVERSRSAMVTHCVGCVVALGAVMSDSAVQAQESRPASRASSRVSVGPEWRPLFNGKDLAGFWGCGTEDPRKFLKMTEAERAARRAESQANIHAHWRVEDGVLINDGHGHFLTTVESFADFELALEYRTVAGADSGIYLRGLPQVQIWDWTRAGGKWHLGAHRGSGGLWNNTPGAAGRMPTSLEDRPFGEWNALHIRMVGDRVSVALNGKCVVFEAVLENYFERGAPLPERGPIQLQTHGGEIEWRDVRVRAPAPDMAGFPIPEAPFEVHSAGAFGPALWAVNAEFVLKPQSSDGERPRQTAFAQVVASSNTQDSAAVSAELSRLLGDAKSRVVHFSGSARAIATAADPAEAIHQFEAHLRRMVKALRNHADQLIWMPDVTLDGTTQRRGWLDRYNKIGERVMRELAIPIHDLRPAFRARAADWLARDGSLTADGRQILVHDIAGILNAAVRSGR